MIITNTDKLAFFQELYDTAKAAMDADFANMAKWFNQYKGSDMIDCEYGPAQRAGYVRNITYELIESQVSSYIPNPSVSPQMWSDKNEKNAKSIETMLKSARDRLSFEEQNDIDERYSPIYGGSVWLVEFDEGIVRYNTVGDIRVTCIPPNRFVGEPNLYDTQSMEYCFVSFETTKDELCRKYDVDREKLDNIYTEDGDNDEVATLYVCYYRNEDGNVCKYAWSGDAELQSIDDYYQRKRKVCRICGEREELCRCEENGKKPHYDLVGDEYEEITTDIKLSDGSVIKSQTPKIENGKVVAEKVVAGGMDAVGNVAMKNAAGVFVPAQTTVDKPVMEQTRLPFYKPTMLPIVIRKNTSAEKKLFGQSDCEFIRPQQQAINKIESRIMEKLIRGGVYPILPDDAMIDLDNSVLERVIRCTRENVGLFNKLDLTPDISRDIAMADRIYDEAKRILGISDSFQGQYDGSAQSGVAKQLQIQQSAGRLTSKRQLKNAAYAEMDKIIFQFMLAYADEPRPACYIDAYGRRQNCSFNRYDFLELGADGQYHYNDEYLFSADASGDIEKNREFLWQENRVNFQSGAYGDTARLETLLVFWLNMEKAHYPNAHDNVTRIQEEIARQAQMEQLQAQAQMAMEENQALAEEIELRKGYEGYLEEIAKRGNVNG